METKRFIVREIVDKDYNGYLINLGLFYSDKNAKWCLISFLMQANIHGTTVYDEELRRETEEKYDIFVGKNGTAFVEMEDGRILTCKEERG